MTSIGRRAAGTGLVLVVVALLLLLTREFLTREPAVRGAPENPPGTRAEGTSPRLRGSGVEESSPQASAPRNVPPGCVRVTLLAKESREPLAGAHWRVDRGVQTVAEGLSDADGTVLLSVEAANAWEHSRLRIWAEGRRDEHAPMPEGARGSRVEILLANFYVDFEGVVLDEAGRPVEGAGVVVWYWNHTSSILDSPHDVFRTKTNDEGSFRLSAKVWHPDDEGMDGHLLWVGAPGFVPATLEPDKRGEDGLVIRLSRDTEGGVVEVRALLADGAPARDADLWFEGAPQGRDAQRFAELWREPTDTRPPGWATWTRIGRRETWWRRLDEDGACTLHPVPPGLHRLQILTAEGAADLTVDVAPAPTTTRVPVTLEPLRTVRGSVRVAREPGWHCGHEAHEHVVKYDDWPEPPQPRKVASGAFEWMDLPPRVASMRIVTAGHPDVVVALPAEGPASVGEVVVLSAREVEGILRWPEGRKPEPWSGVRLVDREGTLAETTTYYTSDGGPRFRLVMPRRPAADAWLVVRLRMAHGDRSPEVRLDGPHDLESGSLLDLTLPSWVPARED